MYFSRILWYIKIRRTDTYTFVRVARVVISSSSWTCLDSRKRVAKSPPTFLGGVDLEFIIVTFIPLTICKAWRTSINYSERWKILLQLLRRYANSLSPPTRCLILWIPHCFASLRAPWLELTKETADQSIELCQRTRRENPLRRGSQS